MSVLYVGSSHVEMKNAVRHLAVWTALVLVAPTGIEPVYHAWEACILTIRWKRQVRKLGDSNPRYGNPYVSLANWWFQPLTQTSLFCCCVISQTRCKGTAFFRTSQLFGKKNADFSANSLFLHILCGVCAGVLGKLRCFWSFACVTWIMEKKHGNHTFSSFARKVIVWLPCFFMVLELTHVGG